MDSELGKSTWIAVLIISTVVILAAVTANATMGRGMFNGFINTMGSYIGLSYSEIAEMAGTYHRIPAATAQGTVLKQRSDIDMVNSKLTLKTISDGIKVSMDFNDLYCVVYGEVLMDVRAGDSGYIVEIHDTGCAAFRKGQATCTCER